MLLRETWQDTTRLCDKIGFLELLALPEIEKILGIADDIAGSCEILPLPSDWNLVWFQVFVITHVGVFIGAGGTSASPQPSHRSRRMSCIDQVLSTIRQLAEIIQTGKYPVDQVFPRAPPSSTPPTDASPAKAQR